MHVLQPTVLAALYLAVVSVVAEQAAFQLQDVSFHPRSYSKSTAKCPAKDRQSNLTVLIDIAYVDVNPSAKSTILLVHGWPSLWSTWKFQILALQEEYHLLIPDLRGFGESTHPGDVQSSGTIGDMVGDLACVLNHAAVDSAICVGHDWGSQICFESARMRPELIEGVAGVTMPYVPSAGPFLPVEALLDMFPRFSYQIFFQNQTDLAAAELDKDIRRSLRSVFRTIDSPPPTSFLTSTTSFLDAYGGNKQIDSIPFFSEDEENYLVEQYTKQGFEKTLQFYCYDNRFNSHAFSHAQGNWTITQPVLSIYPTEDPVADWMSVSTMLNCKHFLPNYQAQTIKAHHWPQLESPVELNKMLKQWLEELKSKAQTHIADEL